MAALGNFLSCAAKKAAGGQKKVIWHPFDSKYSVLSHTHARAHAQTHTHTHTHTHTQPTVTKTGLENARLPTLRHYAVSYTHLTLPTKRIV